MAEDVVTESASATAKVKGDQALSEALLSEVLPAGAVPAANCASPEGHKSVLEALTGEAAAKHVTKKPKKDTPVENAEPKTLEE